MKPSASSATDWTKPGPACVTSTPAADAASTSMLRISTAQRTKARSFGSRGKISLRPCGEPVGDDDIDIAGRRDQADRIQRVVALMQLDLGDRLQAVEAALAVILRPRLRRMGEQDFHVSKHRMSVSVSRQYPKARGSAVLMAGTKAITSRHSSSRPR